MQGIEARGIELDPWLTRLAQTNGLKASQGDILVLKPQQDQLTDLGSIQSALFSCWCRPFFPSPNAQRQASRQGGDIGAWIRAAMTWVRPRGGRHGPYPFHPANPSGAEGF